MLNQPTSSPMMTRMLGLRCGCCCADAGMTAAIKAASDATRPNQIVLVVLMLRSSVGYRGWAGSLRPIAVAPSARRGIGGDLELRLETGSHHAGLVDVRTRYHVGLVGILQVGLPDAPPDGGIPCRAVLRPSLRRKGNDGKRDLQRKKMPAH